MSKKNGKQVVIIMMALVLILSLVALAIAVNARKVRREVQESMETSQRDEQTSVDWFAPLA